MSHATNKAPSATAQSINTFTNPTDVQDFNQYPDARGHFGVHGGRFVSETLMAALEELETFITQSKKTLRFGKNITMIWSTMSAAQRLYIMLSVSVMRLVVRKFILNVKT